MDLIRHQSVFDPHAFHGVVGIIGVGALGSALALHIAKLGVREIVLFDADVVESHNLPNQLYGPTHVGRLKAEAMSGIIEWLTGTRADAVARNVTTRSHLTSRGITHAFACVDSMEARRTVFDHCVFLNPRVRYYCEGRMGSRAGMVTGFDPTHVEKARAYQALWYPDGDVPVETGSCGHTLSIGATAAMLASQMCWHFINACGTEPHANHDEFAFHCGDARVIATGTL